MEAHLNWGNASCFRNHPLLLQKDYGVVIHHTGTNWTTVQLGSNSNQTRDVRKHRKETTCWLWGKRGWMRYSKMYWVCCGYFDFMLLSSLHIVPPKVKSFRNHPILLQKGYGVEIHHTNTNWMMVHLGSNTKKQETQESTDSSDVYCKYVSCIVIVSVFETQLQNKCSL